MSFPINILTSGNDEIDSTPHLLKTPLSEPAFQGTSFSLPIIVGKNENDKCIFGDLVTFPHLMILGASGSGKSIFLRSLLASLLYHVTPEQCKLMLVDTKFIEFNSLNGLPHLLVPVIQNSSKAVGALHWLQSEMQQRLKTFSSMAVRDIESCNLLLSSLHEITIPRIVLIIDELTDIMNVNSKEVENILLSLSQSGRVTGIHLAVSTFSRKNITTSLKAGFPSKISFAVSSITDSKSILGTTGAERLRGMGEMLYSPLGIAKAVKLQGYYLSDNGMYNLVSYIKSEDMPINDIKVAEDINKRFQKVDNADEAIVDNETLQRAIECVVQMGQASTSSLQRRLKLRYANAARIIDLMEQKGIVGPFEGSRPRKVLISKERWIQMKQAGKV